MRKRSFSFRFHEITDKEIRELTRRWRCNRTAAVENAISVAVASGILLAKPICYKAAKK